MPRLRHIALWACVAHAAKCALLATDTHAQASAVAVLFASLYLLATEAP